MKNANLLLILFTSTFFSSCTVTKKIEVKQLSLDEISSYYQSKKIPLSKVLLIKSAASYQNLGDLNLAELPSVIIFDNDGRQINYAQVDYCVADPIKFIEEYSEENQLEFTDYKQSEYLNHIKGLNDNVDLVNDILNSKTKNVFVNTAVYADKIGMNKKPFKMLKLENQNFKIFYVNIDLQINWKIKSIQSL